MTVGQTVIVLLGLIGTIVVILLPIDVYDVEKALSVYGEIIAVVSLPVLYGLWWLGRVLFPPKRTAHGRCAKCGYHLTSTEAGMCPECGAGA